MGPTVHPEEEPHGAEAAAGSKSFTYTNPDWKTKVRDCQIVKLDGTYYMTGPFPPFGPEAQSPGAN